jgi:hypothetical protein
MRGLVRVVVLFRLDFAVALDGRGLLELVARATRGGGALSTLRPLGTRRTTTGPVRTLLSEVRLGHIRLSLPERVGRLTLTEIALEIIVAYAVVAEFGVALSRVWTISGHRVYLARLAVPGMAPAPLAVLAQRDAIRVIALGLLGLVVPALAVLACEGDSDPDVSAGHERRAPRVVGS